MWNSEHPAPSVSCQLPLLTVLPLADRPGHEPRKLLRAIRPGGRVQPGEELALRPCSLLHSRNPHWLLDEAAFQRWQPFPGGCRAAAYNPASRLRQPHGRVRLDVADGCPSAHMYVHADASQGVTTAAFDSGGPGRNSRNPQFPRWIFGTPPDSAPSAELPSRAAAARTWFSSATGSSTISAGPWSGFDRGHAQSMTVRARSSRGHCRRQTFARPPDLDSPDLVPLGEARGDGSAATVPGALSRRT